MERLPIGILVPTRNCATRVSRHMSTLLPLLELAQELVIVDSQSTDGTLEALKPALAQPNTRLLSYPPGLYESWNFGIGRISAPYVYVSTVGDTIQASGLKHLLETAVRFGAEVVLSPPAFERDGRQLPGKEWTIHQYLRSRQIRQPAPLPRSHWFLGSVFAGPAGMMGSSASNLYRTRVLQAAPFPTEFGHVGDTAWGVKNSLFTAGAITPEPCATFELHPNAGQVSETAESELADRLVALAGQSLRQALEAGAAPAAAQEFDALIRRYAARQADARRANGDYQRWRRSGLPWFLHPRAWASRRQRDRARRSIDQLRQAAFRKYDF